MFLEKRVKYMFRILKEEVEEEEVKIMLKM